MKQTIAFLGLMSIFSTAFAAANTGKGLTELNPPQLIYSYLAENFGDFNESIGGFSYEISLKSLDCSVSVTEQGIADGSGTTATCTATNLSGDQLDASGASVKELILTLINNGVKVDSTSEPGTGYISVEGLSCASLEPRSNNPAKDSLVTYSCEAKLN